MERKTAIINGATGGIGSAVAQVLANNYDLLLLGRDDSLLSKAKLSIKELVPNCKVDLLIIDYLKDNFDKLNEKLKFITNISIFVNAVGIVPIGNILQIELQTWKEAFEVGFFATTELVKIISKCMVKNSSIVFISGVLAKQPEVDFVVSSSITGALQNFAKAASKELIKDGIRINSVLPSATNTKLWSKVSKQLNIHNATLLGQIASEHPLKRLAKPSEIANLVVYLCSEQANYINGASFVIDGGVTSIV